MTSPNPYAIDADTLSGMKPLRKVVFSLGANLGDREDNLQGAVAALADTPDVMLVDVSSVYATDPVGAPEGSPEFLNAVVLAETTLSEARLAERIAAVESAFGRTRTQPNEPRNPDVDLIVLGDLVTERDGFVVPHPRAHERAFVLVPWAEIDPDADLPGRGRVRELLARLDASGVRRRDDVTLDG